ncbi:hypothetical protein pb186bvf_003352 [Paramecium bursaria]
MKVLYLLVALVLTNAIEFSSLQDALDFDTSTYNKDNCQLDDEYTNTVNRFLLFLISNSYKSWLDLLQNGWQTIEEDIAILTEAREYIEDARKALEFVDEQVVGPLEEEHPVVGGDVTNPSVEGLPEPVAEPEVDSAEETDEPSADDDDEGRDLAAGSAAEGDDSGSGDGQGADDGEDDDPFGWGEGEVPQVLVHTEKDKQFKKKHAAFIQIVNKGKQSRITKIIRNIIQMAETLDDDQGIADYKERQKKKLQICDTIIHQLDQTIHGVNKVVNDPEYDEYVTTTLQEKIDELLGYIHECGAHYKMEVSFRKKLLPEQPKKSASIKKSKHRKSEVSFLQLNQVFEDDNLNGHLIKQQQEILQNQGMLGFLRNYNTRVKIIN